MAVRSLTLELPTLLYQRLEELARDEGVSLAQYVLDVLTRQVGLPYRIEIVPPEVQEEQRAAFARLLASLPSATDEQIEQFLAEREPVEPDSALPPDVIARLRARMQSKGTSARDD